MVRIQAGLRFEPQKVNVFNKDCRRGGKEVTCMSLTACLSLRSRSGAMATEGVGESASGGRAGWPRPSVTALGWQQLHANPGR